MNYACVMENSFSALEQSTSSAIIYHLIKLADLPKWVGAASPVEMGEVGVLVSAVVIVRSV